MGWSMTIAVAKCFTPDTLLNTPSNHLRNGYCAFKTLSMKLATWKDGFVFDTDPRREDPLYYYLLDGAWGSDSVVGFEIDPRYNEHKATSVCIRVFARSSAARKRDESC